MVNEITRNIKQVDKPRWKYLHSALGLDHDPFARCTAEGDADPSSQPEEIRARIEEDPPFYDYFVEPPIDFLRSPETALPKGKGLLSLLLDPRPVIVFGESGSGKTMLRLIVEHEIRVRYGYSLGVTHILGKGPQENDPTSSFAVDLFIQTVERYWLLNTEDKDLHLRLSRFWQMHVQGIEHILSALLGEEQAYMSITGIARWWWKLGRPVVPNTPLTSPLRNFLEETQALMDKDQHPEGKDDSMIEGMKLAGRLGFQQIYFLFDAADTEQDGIKTWQHVWRQLNKQEKELSRLQLNFKYFLPLKFQKYISYKNLPPRTVSVILAWDYPMLEQLIANRFRSASKWMQSIEAISAIPDLTGQLIVAADGSPRRLMQIISALVDAHAGRAAEEQFIREEDWETMRQQWGGTKPISALNNERDQ